MIIAELWGSTSQQAWEFALSEYDNYVNSDNRAVEVRINTLDINKVKAMDARGFYKFLYEDYFVWKYTAQNRLATTRKSLETYLLDDSINELGQIHKGLFGFDKSDIVWGLLMATRIRGLGVAGASGLLAVLFPEHFGTVDQFVVKALQSIPSLPHKSKVIAMKPLDLSIKDGEVLIGIMRDKAVGLNCQSNSNYWTPRKIDMVLWAAGHHALNKES